MTAGPDSAAQIVRVLEELRDAGLTGSDVERAAFVAFALRAGWSKARIGRYTGISRARVGQKVQKLEDYAACRPTLALVMREAGRAKPREAGDRMIRFSIEDWADPAFADEMLRMVAA